MSKVGTGRAGWVAQAIHDAGKFDGQVELLRTILAAAPDEAIEHRAESIGRPEANGWLYNLINEDGTRLGEVAWQMVIGEIERRDVEKRRTTP